MFTLPLEIIAGALTIQYWNRDLDKAVAITIFLLTLTAINLFGTKGYGEAEFLFSTIKVTAIVGFMFVLPPLVIEALLTCSLLGIVINIGGTPDSGYIGGKFWSTPGAMRFGFKGFCSVVVAASFSFGGTELVGLAAAEAANPRKTLPSAIKQVFWRITMFYVVALLLVGLLVPYDEARLVDGESSVDASASPFVIAVESAGKTILPSVMNAVILVAVLSVGNSSIYGASRTLSSLAEQSHAPRFLRYVDRAGRPLVAIILSSAFGLLAYLADVKGQSEVFDWLFAICGLSSLFTWMSICLCHIQFRRAWKAAGNSVAQLPFQAQSGVAGSYVALVGDFLVLVCQVWAAVSPVDSSPQTPGQTAKAVMLQIMALPIVVLFYTGHKLWFRTSVVRVDNMDIDTGRSFGRLPMSTTTADGGKWPLWKKVYRYFC